MPLDKIGDLTTKRAHGEFSAPFLEVDEQYTIGDRWKFIPVGVQPIESADERINRLEGNYGVTYRINITLENPQPTPEKANISFAPGGGPAFGSIFVDDKFFQTSLARPPDDITIATYTLQPGERKRIRVETIPESGSNYPIRIIVKSRKIQ
jgi:hypothetical protein